MFEVAAFAALGLIIGSFLNVLILRYGRKSIGGRSECRDCGQRLSWRDLIPVVSWVALRGRCRYCGARISIQYPLVELATALLFALVAGLPLSLGIIYTLLLSGIAALLLAIAVYDLYHTIIPDPWVYAFIALSLFTAGPLFLLGSTSVPVYLFSGPLAALPLFALWAVSHGRWMGFGDVKLALGIGYLLGPLLGILSVFFAFIIGAVVSVGILIPLPYIISFVRNLGITSLAQTRKGFTMGSEIPFGPFLVSSCLIVWFTSWYGVDLSAIPLVGSLWSSSLQ